MVEPYEVSRVARVTSSTDRCCCFGWQQRDAVRCQLGASEVRGSVLQFGAVADRSCRAKLRRFGQSSGWFGALPPAVALVGVVEGAAGRFAQVDRYRMGSFSMPTTKLPRRSGAGSCAVDELDRRRSARAALRTTRAARAGRAARPGSDAGRRPRTRRAGSGRGGRRSGADR